MSEPLLVLLDEDNMMNTFTIPRASEFSMWRQVYVQCPHCHLIYLYTAPGAYRHQGAYPLQVFHPCVHCDGNLLDLIGVNALAPFFTTQANPQFLRSFLYVSGSN